MTCIVGFIDKGKVYIGGDSAGVNGYDLMTREDDKVFINREFIFGFTTSFRMGQILRYNFLPPKKSPFISDETYLHHDFIDRIIEILKEKKYAKIELNQIEGGTFLFGYQGKLYYVGNDFQIGVSNKNYDSIGCGKQYALGALYALEKYKLAPEKKIRIALKAAEMFSTGVKSPFKILSI